LLPIVVLLSVVSFSEQVCCHYGFLGMMCAGKSGRDGYSAECNYFCCNCDDGCGPPINDRRKRSEDSEVSYSMRHFMAIDYNGDGVISEEEGRSFLANGTLTERVKRDIQGRAWFTGMDTNKDAFIQPGEMDNIIA
ncbi:hypothetical protein PMAYCL1PPCAC_26393, partial [Pristionchus mayeri]